MKTSDDPAPLRAPVYFCRHWNGIRCTIPRPSNNPADLFCFALEELGETCFSLKCFSLAEIYAWYRYCEADDLVYEPLDSPGKTLRTFISECLKAGNAAIFPVAEGKWNISFGSDAFKSGVSRDPFGCEIIKGH